MRRVIFLDGTSYLFLREENMIPRGFNFLSVSKKIFYSFFFRNPRHESEQTRDENKRTYYLYSPQLRDRALALPAARTRRAGPVERAIVCPRGAVCTEASYFKTVSTS